MKRLISITVIAFGLIFVTSIPGADAHTPKPGLNKSEKISQNLINVAIHKAASQGQSKNQRCWMALQRA